MKFAQSITDSGIDPARFTLRASSGDAPTRTLLHEGRPVAEIKGVDLVAHFAVEDIGWLLITDFDCPFEETVQVHLLDREFQPLDRFEFDEPYRPGVVESVVRLGETRFRLAFPDAEHRHLIEVAQREEGWFRTRTRWLLVTPDPAG